MPETQYFTSPLILSPRSSSPYTNFTAKLAYWTLGSPSNPAVLLPTCYGGTLATTLPFLYSTENNNTNPPLPSSKYFIIVTGLLSGGESSSPSNTAPPFSGPDFPKMTYEENIHLQHSLCLSLGIEKLFAYIGFSMGGQQAYHMSLLYPNFVENAVCIAGSARTSWHNFCFLEGPKAALENSVDFCEGRYETRASKGIRAFERVYSTWALSPEWFRAKQWEKAGCGELEEYLEKYWSGNDGSGDANDLLSLLWTWQKGDVGIYFPDDGGDLEKTLARVKARMLVMPGRTDQYFPPEDSEVEVKGLGKKGELRVIDTVWGHLAGGGGGTEEDTEFIKREVKRFLGV